MLMVPLQANVHALPVASADWTAAVVQLVMGGFGGTPAWVTLTAGALTVVVPVTARWKVKVLGFSPVIAGTETL
jgi:hypothetical protein